MSINFIPSESERLKFVLTCEDYLEDIYKEHTAKVAQRMELRAFSELPKEETEKFVRACEQANELETDLEVVILDKNTGEFLGCAAVLALKRSVPELGIWLKESAWGHGYGREAVAKLLDWIFAYKDYKYVLYACDRDNLASRRLAESFGATIDNVYDHVSESGMTLNVCEYHLTNPHK
ncbi:GNAT family N-acetyltransferase [bacterium]|nr:GNAT family N-acetyltransferase [bacterium]